jgi:hypothetical protein
VEVSPVLEMDEATSDRLSGRGEGEALAIRERESAAIVLTVFPLGGEAIRGRKETLSQVSRGNPEAIDQRASLLFAHPDMTDSEAASTFGRCVTEVSVPRPSSSPASLKP